MSRVLQRLNLLKMSPKVLSVQYSSTNPQNLPRLPVPKLNDTLRKFLVTAEPHLSPEKFENTKNVVNEFGRNGGIGEKLQKLLEKRAETTENWLSDPKSNWWLNCAYLQYRDPVVVWSSPGLVFPQRKFANSEEKIKFAARVVQCALNFKKLIDDNKIPVEKLGKSELDMQQYRKCFGTCRIPDHPGDSIEYHPKSQHIVVIVKNNFFKVPVYSNNGEILGENQIQDQIQACIRESEKIENPVKVGVLTSDNRDNWASAYKHLLKFNENRQSLSDVQKSLFVLSIDNETPQIEDDIVTAEHALVTGLGAAYNSANRWYDKTVQFVVGPNGINGLTYEHSPAEGGPISVLSDFVIKHIDELEAGKSQPVHSSLSTDKPNLLPFKTSQEIDEAIKVSSDNINKLAHDTEMGYLHFTDYGKNFIKSQKFSPDSFIQMAIQFAFYRLHHVPGAHYESAGTRLYVHGRTECIRSCSNESVSFAKAMIESRDDKEKVQKLKAAIDTHKKYVTDAVQGFGVDRHLLGLKLIAKENGIDVPSLYSDEGYVKSSTYRLSTSQVASVFNAFMCYGPLTNDGYGCCYSPRNNDMWFGLSSMRSNSETSTSQFKKSLEESLQLMKEVLVRAGNEQPIKSKL